MSIGEIPTSEAPDAPPDIGSLKRIPSVLWSPRATFEAIVRRPAILVPFLVLLVLQLGISLAIYKPVIIPFQLSQMADRADVTPEIMARTRQGMEGPFGIAIAATFGVIVGALPPLLWAAVLYFVFTLLMSGRATFPEVYSVALYAAMVQIPHSLVRIPLMIARGDPRVTIGPASLVDTPEPPTFLYGILQGLDLFGIWSWLLVAIGLSVLYRKPTGKLWGPLLGSFLFCLVALAALTTFRPGK